MGTAPLERTRHAPRPDGARDPGGPATATERGLLNPADRDFTLRRVPAAPDLSGLVERYWQVGWDLPAGRQGAVTLLPHPCVNLVFDLGQVVVAGVGRERFSYRLTGRGRVFGVKFRPGGFAPVLGGPVSALTDTVRPLASLWGPGPARALAADLERAADLDGLVAAAEDHLRAHWPPPDPEVDRVGRIVRALLSDQTITRVDQVADRFGLSPRSLQRLFHRYVGVSPKWVLQRYRLHTAAARLSEGPHRPWTEIAFELGYSDQSHFIRDFTRAVGMTPTGYAEACRRHCEPTMT